MELEELKEIDTIEYDKTDTEKVEKKYTVTAKESTTESMSAITLSTKSQLKTLLSCKRNQIFFTKQRLKPA